MSEDHRHYCTQVALNGNLVVPESKPDIERILRVTSTPVITKTAVIDKKVIISGHVLVFIEYVACVPGGKQPVHFMSFKVPFADFIAHSCARPGMEAHLKIEVEHQEFHALDRRNISKLLVLRICVTRLQDKTYEPSPHCCPPRNITSCSPDESVSHLPSEESSCDHGNGDEGCHQHLTPHEDAGVPRLHPDRDAPHQCTSGHRQPKFCPVCGDPLEEHEVKYCVYCGKHL